MDNKMILLVGGVLLALALGLVVYTVLAQIDEKSVVRDSLRQLEGYEVENVRDQELLAPISERALRPVLGGLTNLGRRFTPVGYVDGVRKKFINAGNGSADAVDRFLAIRVLSVLAVVPLFWLCFFWNPIGFSGFTQWAVFLLFCADPCVAVIPMIMAAATEGWAAVAAVVIAYEIATIGTMVVFVTLARAGAQSLRSHWIDHYGHALAGAVILVTSLTVAILGI